MACAVQEVRVQHPVRGRSAGHVGEELGGQAAGDPLGQLARRGARALLPPALGARARALLGGGAASVAHPARERRALHGRQLRPTQRRLHHQVRHRPVRPARRYCSTVPLSTYAHSAHFLLSFTDELRAVPSSMRCGKTQGG